MVRDRQCDCCGGRASGGHTFTGGGVPAGVAGGKCRLYDFKQVRHGDRGAAAEYEGAEPLPDQEFAAILSCGYHIASYEKPDFAKGQAFESLYFLDMHLDGDAVTAAVKKMLKDPACGHIFRVKGFLQNPDGTWLEINATQQEITRKPIANGQDVLIVIGENLVEDTIRAYWKG